LPRPRSSTFSTRPGSQFISRVSKSKAGEEGGLVFDLTLGTGDVGGTFAADTTTDVFSQMAATLTNGVDDSLLVRLTPISGTKVAVPKWPSEGSFFNNPGWDTGAAPPDLAGYTLNGISFELDSLSITPSGNTDTNGNALSNFSVQGTFTFDVSPVAAPAPPGLVLALSGVAGLGGFGWVRRRRLSVATA
jgi:hypothetical protein